MVEELSEDCLKDLRMAFIHMAARIARELDGDDDGGPYLATIVQALDQIDPGKNQAIIKTAWQGAAKSILLGFFAEQEEED